VIFGRSGNFIENSDTFINNLWSKAILIIINEKIETIFNWSLTTWRKINTMAREKEHINLVFIGHVDHGKSTTVGRLLFDAGSIDEQTMRKLKEKAQQLGKSGFEFAFVMDNLKEQLI
jgi:hypothetical protein